MHGQRKRRTKVGLGVVLAMVSGLIASFVPADIAHADGAPPNPPEVIATYVARSQTVHLFWRSMGAGGAPITSYTAVSDPAGSTCTATTNNCYLEGLQNGTPYTFTVTATNSFGTSGPSTPSKVVTPMPSAPGYVSDISTTGTHTSATISWKAPADDGGSPVTGYQVTVEPSGRSCATTTTSCTIAGLPPAPTHTITVRAVNAIGAGKPHTWFMLTPVISITKAPAEGMRGYTRLQGKLLYGEGAMDHVDVSIYRRVVGSTAVSKRATVRVDANGEWVDWVQPRHHTEYFAAYNGGPGAMGTTSTTVSVLGQPGLSMKPITTVVDKGDFYGFTGRVHTYKAGQVVKLQRYMNGAWRTAQTSAVRIDGTYRFIWKVPSTSDYQFRTQLPALPGYVTDYSLAETLWVRW